MEHVLKVLGKMTPIQRGVIFDQHRKELEKACGCDMEELKYSEVDKVGDRDNFTIERRDSLGFSLTSIVVFNHPIN